MNIANLKINEKDAEAGKWLDFMGGRFLLASSRSRKFQAFIAKKMRKLNPSELKRNPEIAIEITNQALAEIVILDWSGITDGTTAFPCTPDNKQILLKVPEVRDWISDASGDPDNFRETLAEDVDAVKSGD